MKPLFDDAGRVLYQERRVEEEISEFMETWLRHWGQLFPSTDLEALAHRVVGQFTADLRYDAWHL